MKSLFLGLGLVCLAQVALAFPGQPAKRQYAWNEKYQAYCAVNETTIYVCNEEAGNCEPECFGESKFMTYLNQKLAFGTPVTYYYCGDTESGVQTTPCRDVTPGVPGWMEKLDAWAKSIPGWQGNPDWTNDSFGG
ncbi:MAG: hypothetical protein IPM57_02495 [Oligoflexia bacterium]|nr:hypothetical protein [Oligoflexia bacterium]